MHQDNQGRLGADILGLEQNPMKPRTLAEKIDLRRFERESRPWLVVEAPNLLLVASERRT
jgi:hypothetical protein